MPRIIATKDELWELLNSCADSEDTGHTDFPGLTYEQGIKAGIEWAMGENSDHPLDKE